MQAANEACQRQATLHCGEAASEVLLFVLCVNRTLFKQVRAADDESGTTIGTTHGMGGWVGKRSAILCTAADYSMRCLCTRCHRAYDLAYEMAKEN